MYDYPQNWHLRYGDIITMEMNLKMNAQNLDHAFIHETCCRVCFMTEQVSMQKWDLRLWTAELAVYEQRTCLCGETIAYLLTTDINNEPGL